MVAIAEISFAGILELNFYQIAFFSVSGNIGQPVVVVCLACRNFCSRDFRFRYVV